MKTESQKNNLRTWIDEHSLGLIYLACIFMFVFCIIVSLPMIDEFMKILEQNIEYTRERSYTGKFSYDCSELRYTITSLLSSGANSDSWFPNHDDSLLKITEKRYEVICK